MSIYSKSSLFDDYHSCFGNFIRFIYMIRARSRETKAKHETLYKKRPLLKFKKSYSIKYSKKNRCLLFHNYVLKKEQVQKSLFFQLA